MGQLHCNSVNNYVTSGFPLLPSHTSEAASANKYPIIFSLTSQKQVMKLIPKLLYPLANTENIFFLRSIK